MKYISNTPGNSNTSIVDVNIIKRSIINQFRSRGFEPKTVNIITTSDKIYIYCRNNNKSNEFPFDMISIKRKI